MSNAASSDQINQIQTEEPLQNIPTNTTTNKTTESNAATNNVITMFDIVSEIEGLLKNVQKQMTDNDAQFQKSITAIEDKLRTLQR
ncbi:uncharacterized protein GVI51_I09515 [Nakaseomyces glabratus]|uniref:Uncharacterized protein n=1 Tax=Candida glabrata (strain ATCC 2001 / BCRC 20586 / JCM 3761 / NBRC 0622 / NRRL Y-65 / CBS 138) TaxID=284593 RepID=Q6FQ27_CANGA|nr:uncharacterized protein CAGL0I09658g [Nakaseomyces glabratus]KAH7586652.1 hypothetical protein J7297_02945 [Nakaseomyces glabratus]KAH7590500.1 hypothetical protein J7296_02753 [Nakaseomyces glabratus]KAH7599928.1 hypothetical protein J7294_02943 [Nakaseomyces glabratus]KAH7604760.1 hypothetical protein J7293_02934 [Nakaseomyces glabratus]KAI8396210.1 hypothetical protein J6895_02773 [Nakaseomyces glabratus]|eukprot:XP_447667.1 uncharacterized protein CAGL0I09658g [[Candida] glabrata]